jgi:hypothetical protein
MNKNLTIFFCLFFLWNVRFLNAQSTFSIEALTVGIHPFGNPNVGVYENNLDSMGIFNTEPGLMLSYEFFIKDNWLSLQLSQSVFADAAGLTAGFTEFSMRFLFFHKYRNQLYIELGPALTYRRSWDVLGPRYTPETTYKKDGKMEYRPSAIAKLEYDVFIGNNNDINISILYGHSYKTFSFLIGYRHWISTNVRFTKDCNCNHFKQKGWLKKLFKG